MKKLALIVFLQALAGVGLVGNSLADCNVVGTVVATEMDDDAKATGFNKVHVRTDALAGHSFSFTTGDQEIMLVAVIAKSSQMEVRIIGNGASCPADGAERDGGQILELHLN